MNCGISGITIPSEYKIQHNCPTYLSIFLNADEELDFIYKEGTEEVCSPIIVETTKTDLDLTGSPLKLELADDSYSDQIDEEIIPVNLWLESEEKHFPISYNTVLQLYNNYTCNRKLLKKLGIWVWFLTNENASKVLFGSRLTEGWWNKANVQILPPVRYSEIDLEMFLNDHLQMTRIQPNQVSTTKIYDITEKLSGSVSEASVHPNIKLEIKSRGLSLKKLNFAEITLKQEIAVGNMSSLAYELWKELCIVQNLFTLILRNRNTSNDRLYNIDMPKSELVPIMENVQAILNAIDETDEDNNQKTVDLPSALKDIGSRPNHTFCSKLWIVLKECSTYTQLLKCLNTIFLEVAHGNCSIQLEDNCSTHLETLLRDVKLKRATIPCFTGLQPLELLLEIGVEKLCQDYIFLFKGRFSSASLPFYEVPAENMSNSMKKLNLLPRTTMHPGTLKSNIEQTQDTIFQNSKFEMREYEHKFKILARVHVIIEHLLTSATAFGLDMGNTQDLCSKLMNIVLFENNQNYTPPNGIGDLFINKKQSISISGNSGYFTPAINKKLPSSMQVTFESKMKFQTVTTKINLNTRSIFHPGMYQSDVHEERSRKDDDLYYVTRFCSIESKVPNSCFS